MTTAAVIEATYSKIHEAQEFFEHLCHYWKVPFWQIFSHSGHIDLREQIKEILVRWQKTGVCTVLLVLAHTFFQTSMRSLNSLFNMPFPFPPSQSLRAHACVCVSVHSLPHPILRKVKLAKTTPASTFTFANMQNNAWKNELHCWVYVCWGGKQCQENKGEIEKVLRCFWSNKNHHVPM